jgi:hypothetical protein
MEYTRRRKKKKKHNTICVGHHYVQAKTNNVNMGPFTSFVDCICGQIETNKKKYFLKSGLIRGVAFNGRSLIRGVLLYNRFRHWYISSIKIPIKGGSGGYGV